MSFIPTPDKLFHQRGDKSDPRLGELVKPARLSELEEKKSKSVASPRFALIGYPDDDGIALNGGRIGAKEAPARIRQFFYKMTPPAHIATSLDIDTPERQDREIFDFGDLDCANMQELERRHATAQTALEKVFAIGMKSITLGGGHDYGFPDAAAFCRSCPKDVRPLVINFDAHLDVRPSEKSLNSGTPFYRLLNQFPDIDLLEVGLQSQCNSVVHLNWARERGALVSFQEDRLATGESLTQVLRRFLGETALKNRPTFISVDIDGFSSAFAPGASQVWPTGFSCEDFFDAFSWCLHRLDVRGVGIYEVSPKWDVDDRTSRLAALIVHRFVFQL